MWTVISGSSHFYFYCFTPWIGIAEALPAWSLPDLHGVRSTWALHLHGPGYSKPFCADSLRILMVPSVPPHPQLTSRATSTSFTLVCISSVDCLHDQDAGPWSAVTQSVSVPMPGAGGQLCKLKFANPSTVSSFSLSEPPFYSACKMGLRRSTLQGQCEN